MADENITLRKKQIQSTSFSETSLFDATVMSMPETSLRDDETIATLQEEINDLRIKLQSANQEVDNLLCENKNLKSDLDKCNRVIELYKKVGAGEAKCATPGSKRKVFNTKLQVSSLTSTPIKKSFGNKSTCRIQTLNKETQTSNLTAHTPEKLKRQTSTACSNKQLRTEKACKRTPTVLNTGMNTSIHRDSKTETTNAVTPTKQITKDSDSSNLKRSKICILSTDNRNK